MAATIRRQSRFNGKAVAAPRRIGETIMRKLVAVLAALAAATTVAVTKDLKQDKKAVVPTATANQMSDAEMDKVTAGGSVVINGVVVTRRLMGLRAFR